MPAFTAAHVRAVLRWSWLRLDPKRFSLTEVPKLRDLHYFAGKLDPHEPKGLYIGLAVAFLLILSEPQSRFGDGLLEIGVNLSPTQGVRF